MTRYKFILRKRKKLSQEQIEKYKNFTKLVHEYDHAVKPLYKKPLYKNRKAYLVILLILLIVYLISEFSK